uniref:Uncharacterized protein n=1 Tax=Eutreptiella gymnastica TaxID=73025 RepID=A0A7S1J2U6_9EUGL
MKCGQVNLDQTSSDCKFGASGMGQSVRDSTAWCECESCWVGNCPEDCSDKNAHVTSPSPPETISKHMLCRAEGRTLDMQVCPTAYCIPLVMLVSVRRSSVSSRGLLAAGTYRN